MKKILFCLFILASLSGCAHDLGHRFAPTAPQGNMALIYYYRPSNFFGSGVSYDIKENGQSVVSLYNGGYYPHLTFAGYKTITAWTTTVSFYAESGKTYFIRGKEHMGLILYHPAIKLVPEEKALREIQMCRLIK